MYEISSDLSDAEIEAIEWRATEGIVPWFVWNRLTLAERSRIGALRPNGAALMLERWMRRTPTKEIPDDVLAPMVDTAKGSK